MLTGDTIEPYLSHRAQCRVHPRALVLKQPDGTHVCVWDGAPERITLGVGFLDATSGLLALANALNGELLR